MNVLTSFACFLIACVVVASLSHMEVHAKVAPNDPIYKEKTGKTYDELLASKEYIRMDEFAHSTDTEWKDHTRTDGLVSRAPDDPDPGFIKFYLYTSKHPNGVQIEKAADPILAAGWQSGLKVKIIIHGYTNNVKAAPIKKIVNAYLESPPPVNIIAVDWGHYSLGWYFDTAKQTDPIGKIVGEYIYYLIESELTASLEDVHVIGFSLGAHIAGHAGAFIQTIWGNPKNLGRITGLDPAGPGFHESESAHRLDAGDANFVDIIHTNMGDLNPFSNVRFGTVLRSGDADFYPNGGQMMPGCHWPVVGELVGICSHLKAPEYFALSIRTPDKYKACQCGSYAHFREGKCNCGGSSDAIMGEHCKKGTFGTFFLRF